MRRERTIVVGVVATLILGLAGSAPAATYNWNVANGDWSTAGNWDTGVEPLSTDNAAINNSGTVNITAAGEVANALWVGFGGTNLGNVLMTAGDLTTNNTHVGQNTNDVGIFTQSGGTHNVKNFTLGANGGVGTYNLQGGVLDTFGNDIERIGNSGAAASGTFNQTGGSNTTDQIWMAVGGGTSAAYNLDAGSVSIGRFLIIGMSTAAASSTGTFTQTGGTNTVGTALSIGWGSNGSGAYAISGGSVGIASLVVGNNGTGTFTVTGANPTIGAVSYSQNALSTLNAQIDAGGISTINVSGAATLDGIFNVTDLGSAPVGTFNILVATGGITGSHATVNLPGGGNWSSGITGNTLWVTNIPEPASMGLMLIGAGLMVVRSRRRK